MSDPHEKALEDVRRTLDADMTGDMRRARAALRAWSCGVKVSRAGRANDILDDDALIEYTADDAEELEKVIAATADDLGAWDVLAFLFEKLTAKGAPLPPPLREWITDAIRGDIQRPKRAAYRPRKNEYRDLRICMAMAGAIDAGLNEDEAAELIADPLTIAGMPSKKRILQIWEKRPFN